MTDPANPPIGAVPPEELAHLRAVADAARELWRGCPAMDALLEAVGDYEAFLAARKGATGTERGPRHPGVPE